MFVRPKALPARLLTSVNKLVRTLLSQSREDRTEASAMA